MLVPHKKPNKRSKISELTDEQKAENRQLSSVRVRVEHSIRRIKGWSIMRTQFRLATGLFSCIASAVVGLVQLARICV